MTNINTYPTESYPEVEGLQSLETESGFRVDVHNPEAVNAKLESDTSTPILLLLAGSSESGKSTMGKMAVETDLASRLKYLNISAGILMNGSKSNEIIDVLASLEQPGNEAIFAAFVERYIDLTTEILANRGGIAVVETLKHPGLVRALQASDRVRAFSVFVDADLEKRVERESVKAGLTIEETRVRVLAKDQTKGSLGLEEIRQGADITIMNDGSYEDYQAYSAALLTYLAQFSDIPNTEASVQVS